MSDKFLLGELYKFPRVIEFLLKGGQIQYTQEWDRDGYDLINDDNDYLQSFSDKELYMLLSDFNALEGKTVGGYRLSHTFYTLNKRGRKLLTLSQFQLIRIHEASEAHARETAHLAAQHKSLQDEENVSFSNRINNILDGSK